jgi:hypothetical protein
VDYDGQGGRFRELIERPLDLSHDRNPPLHARSSAVTEARRLSLNACFSSKASSRKKDATTSSWISRRASLSGVGASRRVTTGYVLAVFSGSAAGQPLRGLGLADRKASSAARCSGLGLSGMTISATKRRSPGGLPRSPLPATRSRSPWRVPGGTSTWMGPSGSDAEMMVPRAASARFKGSFNMRSRPSRADHRSGRILTRAIPTAAPLAERSRSLVPSVTPAGTRTVSSRGNCRHPCPWQESHGWGGRAPVPAQSRQMWVIVMGPGWR